MRVKSLRYFDDDVATGDFTLTSQTLVGSGSHRFEEVALVVLHLADKLIAVDDANHTGATRTVATSE